MKFEIGYQKNGVYQARIIEARNADTARAYFAEIEPRATVYGASPADSVKPGQPCTSVPADWTPAAEAPAEAPAEAAAPGTLPAGTRCKIIRAGRRYNGIVCRVLRTVNGDPENLVMVSIPGDAILLKRVNLLPLAAITTAPEKLVPLDPEKARPRQRVFRVVDEAGHIHNFCTAGAALRLAATAGDGATLFQRASNARGRWLQLSFIGLQAAARAETARAAEKAPAVPAAPTADPAPAAPRLHVSAGNTKLGKICNMSLAPGRSCSAEACRTCLVDGCYACKAYRQYGATRRAWNDNTELALHDIPAMENGLNAVFQGMNAPRFFRVHVGGDFISRDYAEMWIRVAEKAPGTRFLAFTKQFDIIRGLTFPVNFTVILSDWPGTTVPADLRQLYRVAWCDDGTRPADTFPANALECPGHCETCGACWNLDRDTIFHKH